MNHKDQRILRDHLNWTKLKNKDTLDGVAELERNTVLEISL